MPAAKETKLRTLLLLRHAKSSWGDGSLDDFQRPLAPRGERAARAVGGYMAQLGLIPKRVLCSPAVRTTETWSIIERALGQGANPETPEALYLAEPQTMLDLVRDTADDVPTVLVIAHNPGIATLALQLAQDGSRAEIRSMAEKYPTGGLAEIQFEAANWRAADEGRLVRFVRPRDLETD